MTYERREQRAMANDSGRCKHRQFLDHSSARQSTAPEILYYIYLSSLPMFSSVIEARLYQEIHIYVE